MLPRAVQGSIRGRTRMVGPLAKKPSGDIGARCHYGFETCMIDVRVLMTGNNPVRSGCPIVVESLPVPDRPKFVAAILLVATVGVALHGARAGATTGCEQAAALAERNAGLPARLLQAIGRVESGRRDPSSGQIAGWPWSVNDGQRGRQFGTRDEAVAYVRDQIASGQRLIDIGCFQIDLFYHPEAFEAWQDGFSPGANAAAAARILADLHARTGDWQQAVALYHSADPARGLPYRDAVMTAWQGTRSPQIETVRPDDPFIAWTSGFPRRVAVWVPSQVQIDGAGGLRRLPRVITP